MEDKQFKFKVKLGGFEFEVAGDRNFVEKTMNRYEGRFLPRFQQLMSGIDRQAGPQQTAQAEETPSRPQPQPQQQQQTERGKQPQQRQPQQGGQSSQQPRDQQRDQRDQQRDQRDQQKEPRKDRSKRSRGKKRNRNNNTWVKPAPEVPKDQEITRAPYIPDDVDVDEEPEVKPTPSQTKQEKPTQAKFDGKLKDLFDKIGPRTHHEKILVFAYYLQERKNFTNFAANDIRGCYEAVNADPAGNINQVLNHASRTGFLNKTQRGRQVKFSITSKGKLFVERGLEPGD